MTQVVSSDPSGRRKIKAKNKAPKANSRFRPCLLCGNIFNSNWKYRICFDCREIEKNNKKDDKGDIARAILSTERRRVEIKKGK